MTASSRTKDNPKKTPPPSSKAAHNRMKAVKRKGTLPELRLRQALDAYGLVYEVNEQPLPELRRRADILFRKERVAIFVDGCFWHGCPLHGTKAKSNAHFWAEKIERNKQRDRDTNRRLKEAGWLVIRVWEHEDPEDVASSIWSLLQKKSNAQPSERD